MKCRQGAAQRKALSAEDEALFKDLAAHQLPDQLQRDAGYAELIEKCVEVLTDTNQYPKVQA